MSRRSIIYDLAREKMALLFIFIIFELFSLRVIEYDIPALTRSSGTTTFYILYLFNSIKARRSLFNKS